MKDSDGLPGYVDSIDLVCDDLIEYIFDIKSKHLKEGMKLFLHGNSMGKKKRKFVLII